MEKYVGGPNTETGTAIALDPTGNIYLTGMTEGGVNTFPVTANAHQPTCGDIVYDPTTYCYQDGVVVELNTLGQVIYSSYHGGSFTDEPQAIATDGQGNVLITGNTASGQFPLAQPLQASCPLNSSTGDCQSPRGFASLIHLDPNHSTLTYSTYLGSTEPDSTNVVTAVAMDSSGKAYITGYTNGHTFPLAGSVQANLAEGFCTTFGSDRYCFDVFALAFSPTGALTFGTYLGGTFDEFPHDVALDTGNLYLTGMTEANNFPVTGNAFQPNNPLGDDAFITKIGRDSGTSGGGGGGTPGNIKVYLPIVIR